MNEFDTARLRRIAEITREYSAGASAHIAAAADEIERLCRLLPVAPDGASYTMAWLETPNPKTE